MLNVAIIARIVCWDFLMCERGHTGKNTCTRGIDLMEISGICSVNQLIQKTHLCCFISTLCEWRYKIST